jgi:hypothetical protein
MFPHVFRVMDDDCVLLLHVISEADPRTRRNYPYLFNQAQLDRRRSFYESEHPEKLSPEQLAPTIGGCWSATDSPRSGTSSCVAGSCAT